MHRSLVFIRVTTIPEESGHVVQDAIRYADRRALSMRAEVSELEDSRLARAIYRNVQEGVVITDARGRIVAANPAFTSISDYSEKELLGRHIRLLRSHRHEHAFYSGIRRRLLATGYWEGEIWNRRRDGEIFPQWVRISCVTNGLDDPAMYVYVVVDVSRMHHAQSQLQHLAHHDSLTGLPNRALLNLRLRHTVERSLRTGETCAVLFLDLDGFKAVNDRLGHEAGDELLRRVSALIRQRVRQNDTVARLGGDEFVIVMENISAQSDATRMAEQLIQQLGTTFSLSNGRQARIGVSIGIAFCPEHGADASSLLRNADGALYDAKGAGRGTWRTHEPTEILPVLEEAAVCE